MKTRAQKAPLQEATVCTWNEDDEGIWLSDCLFDGKDVSGLFEFTTGGPVDNGFRFCPYCARSIAQKFYMEDEEP